MLTNVAHLCYKNNIFQTIMQLNSKNFTNLLTFEFHTFMYHLMTTEKKNVKFQSSKYVPADKLFLWFSIPHILSGMSTLSHNSLTYPDRRNDQDCFRHSTEKCLHSVFYID